MAWRKSDCGLHTARFELSEIKDMKTMEREGPLQTAQSDLTRRE